MTSKASKVTKEWSQADVTERWDVYRPVPQGTTEPFGRRLDKDPRTPQYREVCRPFREQMEKCRRSRWFFDAGFKCRIEKEMVMLCHLFERYYEHQRDVDAVVAMKQEASAAAVDE